MDNHSHMSLVEKYPFLKEFPLYKFYGQLDNVSDEGPEYEECSDLLRNNYNEKSSLSKFCTKVYNISNIFYNIGEIIGSTPSNSCDYLNFWLNENLGKNIPMSMEKDLVNKALDKIFRKIDGPVCGYNNLLWYNRENFLKLKQLHDYAESFNNILNEVNKGNLVNKDSYCSYIIESVNLYENIKKELLHKLSNGYTDELKLFKHKYDQIKSSALSCKKELPNLRTLMELSVAATKVSQRAPEGEGHYKDEMHGPSEEMPEKEVFSGRVLSEEVSFNEMMHYGKSSASTISGYQDFGYTISLPNFVVDFRTILGVSLLLFILYKFMPFGSRIKNRRRSKQGIFNEIAEVEKEDKMSRHITLQDTENDDINWGARRNYIGYYYLQNPELGNTEK
ncbi:variable surface protein [Plasmodium gonderi]|uniref:Variable surface protein n=1 Tax=Plasmodium gonderi TaxID=77519 RepID=A0A1Y1JEI9_PLAGO|nr:variable surface protein [Plasmodium gonderi]GAW78863.1 variable surface protein [Plasmodium gonderi]